MEKDNPLLPFAFSISSINDSIPLDTTPRDKLTIDENASSLYHTRRTSITSPSSFKQPRPVLNKSFPPSLKRKMGESFNDKDDIKRIDIGFEEEEEEEEEEGQEDKEGVDSKDEETRDIIDDITQHESSMQQVPLPPSSPPPTELFTDVGLVSEFDFTTNPETTYEIPKSPTKKIHLNFPSELNDFTINSSPTKKQKLKPLISSEADFGIDKFNRFHGNLTYELLSSTGLDEFEHVNEAIKQSSYNKARDVILRSFEDMETVINLEGMNLYELPTEIKDMNNLVIFDEDDEQRNYHLFLNNNNLNQLPPALFKYTKLQVLSLRINRLTSIPPLIDKLQNLVDLSLGANCLRFLPFQILNLKNLENFTAGPNSFRRVADFPDEDIIEINTKIGQHKLNFRTKIIQLGDHSTSVYLTSLKTQCLTKIAKHDVTYQETKAWKKHTPKVLHKSIKEAITKGKFNDVCYKCDNIVVEPIAQVYEWWDILMNKNVPIRKQFCSQKCVDSYETEMTTIMKCID